jgi:hypothetical protein
MKKGIALVGGFGLGAGLMYLFDPDRGARRRARVRQSLVAASHARDDEQSDTWSPSTRTLAGAAGGALVVYGLARRDVVGTALGAIGAGLAARSLTNTELAKLAHVESMRDAVASQIGRSAKAPVGFAVRKLRSFVESEPEEAREELH